MSHIRGSQAVFVLSLVASWALTAPAGAWLARARSLAESGVRAAELDEQGQKLQDQLEDLKREERDNQALTVARGRAYVRLARAGLMPLSEGFDALAAHASRLERLRRALGRDLARERQLVARRLEISRELRELENMKPADRDALARARTAIVAAQERDEAFARAFQSDDRPAPRTAVYGAQLPHEPSATPRTGSVAPGAGGFAAQRGRLPFPVAGRAEIQKVNSPTGEGKLLVMLSTAGAPVRVVYPGRVAFADDYPDLGNTVIVDHGDHYFTVSSHLERITVQVGEELEGGQRLGTVGMYDQKAALLFEVRAGPKTVNTPEWFGI
jgi:septal ring factor EnvC (AmiA/AmiB activator)